MPEHFKATPTDRQQYMVDLWVAQEHLQQMLPVDCRKCMIVQVEITNRIAERVIKEEISTTQALAEMARRAGNCNGYVYDDSYADKQPDCGAVEAEKEANGTSCR